MPGLTRRVYLLLLVLSVAGCTSTPLPEGKPALITHADADSRRELRQVIGAALGRTNIELADDALTTSSDLLFELTPANPDGSSNRSETVNLPPELFRLLLDGPQCVLVHERTGLRWLLMDTECIAE